MPRTCRGGSRQGQAGASYPNRTDLNTQPVRTGPSTGYGQRVQAETAQQAAPLPATAPPPPFNAGTGAPGEPITAGLAHGAGPGLSPAATSAFDEIELIRALYRQHPNEGLRRYLMELGVE